MTKTSEKQVERDEHGRLKPGNTANLNGRPNGQRNYATIYREALIKIGETKGMSPEQIEEKLEEVGLDKALQGDYKFYQDIRDRVHGKPKQAVEVGGPDGGAIQQNITVSFHE